MSLSFTYFTYGQLHTQPETWPTYQHLSGSTSYREADEEPTRLAQNVELGRDNRMCREHERPVGVRGEDTLPLSVANLHTGGKPYPSI
jgi:hypothetical protein